MRSPQPRTDAQIIARLQGVFDETFLDQVVVTPGLSARDVAEWDSLAHINLVLGVETAFAIRFSVGEVEAARDIGDLVALIARKLGRP